MGERRYFTCDKCSKQFEIINDGPQRWLVGVDWTCLGLTNSYPKHVKSLPRTAEWCRECMVEMGLFSSDAPREKDEKVSEPKPVTFEDLVREIAEGAVEDALAT